MEFLKLKKFRKTHKPNLEKEPVPVPEEPKKENGDDLGKSVDVDNATEVDEDDDDFIMNEVKRRLKELRRNRFMVLIPEETCPEEDEEEEGEASSNEWRDVEAEGRQLWSCFGAFYDKYCERMLFFDRLTTQLLKEIESTTVTGSHNPSTPSPRSVSKKLTSPLRCLSLRKIEHPEDDDDAEQLQQPENDPYLDLETAYVSQLCLTWEALHWQYSQLSQKITCQSESSKCYNHSAQQFQQFQVLLQRFIENEPFERGLRPEIYAQTRNSFSKLMQVPNILGQDRKEMTEEESDMLVHAPDLIRIIESSILTFQLFIKMDKKKSNGVRNLFGGQNQMATPLQQVQSLLEKRKVKLKELWKRRKGGKKNQWPATQEEVELLLGLIDVKVISRVLRMVKISKEQLFWSEEKMKKLDISAATGKLQRDPSPILFPC
ncbi:uncharacterized protein LOC112511053 isoform X1 [Cynara cardunculus var. scolymus]|uniref:uncharacterized protein LOC112511053 isoform X1 n=1 Tax=Cynara cardunculus var. scolymus TaxID=59895 RepID=UPI000D623559|nr:uncharacterized protein LOC112511053 isoform X1 [Cynara cardunculus var. scolymus]